MYRKVSWCSWLSHHFDVVRVPGSNPGGTIFIQDYARRRRRKEEEKEKEKEEEEEEEEEVEE